ncbi:MAG: NERD domain-containing protein [Gammaproteobacteria bacterium]|nr:NERD domain-containing protein [Gammaproteobacteria bacterium]
MELLIIILLFFLPFVLLVSYLRSASFKGKVGESKVKFSGGLWLSSATYHGIHDLTLPTPRGSTQIDHVYVSKFGIFVVETKNYQGWIFGSENQKQWTQVIYGDKFKLPNPLRQNYGHVRAVQAVLDVAPEIVHSVVAFAGDSKFKTPMPPNVTKGQKFAKYIKTFKKVVLSDQEVQAILQQLQSGSFKKGRKTNHQHINNVKASKSGKMITDVCPRCGSKLTLRTAKKGPNAGSKFWGCTNFPRCRFTKDA